MFQHPSGRVVALTPKILPAVYNDAMSYYEQLHIINDKLTEVINEVNTWGTTTLDHANAYTDQQVAALEQRTNEQIIAIQAQLNAQFIQLKEEIEAELDNALAQFEQEAQELLNKLNEEINNFNSIVNNMQIDINVLFDMLGRLRVEMNEEIAAQIGAVMKKIDDALASKLGSGIIVFNPYRKQLTNLDVALADLFSITYRMFALTADEYRRLQLTVDEYVAMDITANDYLYKGRLLFFMELYFPDVDERFAAVYGYINMEVAALDKNHYMISPFTGVITPINQVVYNLARLHMYGITANQYRDALLTVDEYKNKKITAHDYAWDGYYLVYTDAVPKETLEEEIAELQTAVAALTQRVIALENEATPSEIIKNMQDQITVTSKTLTTFQNTQRVKDQTQDTAIEVNRNDIDHLNDVVIPDAIHGLQDTFNTETASLQTQITGITSGLQSIHINYNAAKFSNRKRGKENE